DLAIFQRLVHPLAEWLRRLARRPPGAHHVWVAPALGEVFGGDCRRERGDLAALDVRQQRVGLGGTERPYEPLHALALAERARRRERRGGFGLAVLDEEAPLASGQALALLLEVELEAVLHLLAVGGVRARLGNQHPDSNRPFFRGADARGGDERRDGEWDD